MKTWNMSTATRQLAAACFSISLAGAAWAGGEEVSPSTVLAAELEARVARTPSIYLVVDVVRRVVDIKARTVTLDRVPLHGIEVVTYQRFFSGQPAATLELPTLWTIASGPGDTDREVIAPTSLRPYSSGEDEEAEPAATAPATPPQATPTPAPPRDPPTNYRARVTNGWELLVTDRLPPRGLFARFVAAGRDGLARLRGPEHSFPPTLALAMAPEDAQRLHHLMRSGIPILLVAVP